MYVKLCFSEMAANASDIVSVDFAEILFSRNCDDGDDNIGQFFFCSEKVIRATPSLEAHLEFLHGLEGQGIKV